MTDGVRRFLMKLGLSQHFEMFSAKGFDCEDDIHWLCEEDLNSMYIVDPATRTKILEAGMWRIAFGVIIRLFGFCDSVVNTALDASA